MCVSDRVTGGQVRSVVKDSHPAGLGRQSSRPLGGELTDVNKETCQEPQAIGMRGQSLDICHRGIKTRKKGAEADLGSLPPSPTCQFNLLEAQGQPRLTFLEGFGG